MCRHCGCMGTNIVNISAIVSGVDVLDGDVAHLGSLMDKVVLYVEMLYSGMCGGVFG